MKRILLLVLVALWWPAPAYAQAPTKLCFPTGTNPPGQSCQDVTATNPLPTTATLSASALNVTVTNTTASPAIVTCTNCGTLSAGSAISVTVTNTAATPVIVSTANGFGGAGSAMNVTITNTAAIPAYVTMGDITINPTQLGSLGAAASSNSAPVVIATDQAIITVKNAVGYAGSGGWTMLTVANLLTTTTAIKNSAGQLGKVYCLNPASASTYLQVFNLTPGQVTLGSTKPVAIYGIPTGQAAGFAMGSNGDQFSSAISVAATTTSTGLTEPNWPTGTGLDCTFSYN